MKYTESLSKLVGTSALCLMTIDAVLNVFGLLEYTAAENLFANTILILVGVVIHGIFWWLNKQGDKQEEIDKRIDELHK